MMNDNEWVEAKREHFAYKDPRPLATISKNLLNLNLNTSFIEEIKRLKIERIRFLYKKNGSEIAIKAMPDSSTGDAKIITYTNYSHVSLPKEIKAFIADYREKYALDAPRRKFQVEWNAELNAFVFDLSKGE